VPDEIVHRGRQPHRAAGAIENILRVVRCITKEEIFRLAPGDRRMAGEKLGSKIKGRSSRPVLPTLANSPDLRRSLSARHHPKAPAAELRCGLAQTIDTLPKPARTIWLLKNHI
jgi:hypothetical protein